MLTNLRPQNHQNKNSYRDFVRLSRSLRALGIVPPTPLPGTRGVVAETLRRGRHHRGQSRGWLASLLSLGRRALEEGEEAEEAAFLEARRRGLEVRGCSYV